MIKRALFLQLYTLIGNLGIIAFYYWVLRPLKTSDELVLAFAATIPLAYITSAIMLIWDEANRREAGCLGWTMMVLNLFLIAINIGAVVALVNYTPVDVNIGAVVELVNYSPV